MPCVGINVGALTVKVVAVGGGSVVGRVVPHRGRPLEVLAELREQPEFAAAKSFGVSGRLGHIAESAAIQRAARAPKRVRCGRGWRRAERLRYAALRAVGIQRRARWLQCLGAGHRLSHRSDACTAEPQPDGDAGAIRVLNRQELPGDAARLRRAGP